MLRIALWMSLAVSLVPLAGCKSKPKDQGPTAGDTQPAAGSSTAGSAATGSATEASAAKPTTPPTGAVPALRWTDPDGELMLATGNGDKLEGPCGVTGTITATDVELGGIKEPWTKILRDGRRYSLPKLDWVIELSPSGDLVHKRGGTDTPLGKVTGVTGDAEAAWFGALVIAAPLIQHKVGIESGDGSVKLSLGGSADLRAWEVRDAAGERVGSRMRDDPAPVLRGKVPASFDPTKLTVTIDKPHTYTVTVADHAATRAVFPAAGYTIVENDKGELAWSPAGKKPEPLAKLTGRVACRAHDQAVPALVWSFLATEAGAKAAAPGRKAWAK